MVPLKAAPLDIVLEVTVGDDLLIETDDTLKRSGSIAIDVENPSRVPSWSRTLESCDKKSLTIEKNQQHVFCRT